VNRRAIVSLYAVLAVAALAYEIGAGQGGKAPEGSTRGREAATFDALRKQREARFEAETALADIVMLGDSLTEFGHWAELLPGIVANRGIGGDTSKGVLNRLGEVLRLNPRVVCLLVGTNDLLLGRGLDEISQTVSSIIYSLQEHHISVVLTSVPFVRADFPIRINGEVTRLNQSLRTLTLYQRTDFIDLNAVTADNGELAREDTVDGVHLSNKAYEKWAAALRPVLDHLAEASRN
jgi:lysophospholipase L1-like esterase